MFLLSSSQEGRQRSVDGQWLVRRAALSYIPRSLQTTALSQSLRCCCPRSRSDDAACIDHNLQLCTHKCRSPEEAVQPYTLDTVVQLQKQRNKITPQATEHYRLSNTRTNSFVHHIHEEKAPVLRKNTSFNYVQSM